MNENELHWLAGLLEGEGSFMRPAPSKPNVPRISLEMTDLDIITKAAALMQENYICKPSKRKEHWKDTYRLNVRGKKAAALMSQLRPLMGTRRQQQIEQALTGFVPRNAGDGTRKLTPEQVVKIKNLILLKQESTDSIGARFGVSGHLIRLIRSGKIHHHSRES